MKVKFLLEKSGNVFLNFKNNGFYFPKSIIFILISSSIFAQTTLPAKPSVHSIIELVRKKYAPDKRTAIFQIESDSNKITGKTNIQSAKRELINRLKSIGYDFKFNIKLLPDEKELDSKIFAVVNVSVANIRSQPRESAELVTQAFLGICLKILDKEKYWYQVQTPDNYIGWVESMTIKRISEEEKNYHEKQPKLIFMKPFGFSYEDSTENSQTISDLTWGDLIYVTDSLSEFYKVKYPDSRTAFVRKNEAKLFSEWKKQQNPDSENLVKTAKSMMGLPYLWGGTSWKGVDCSGFTRIVYQTHGIQLQRDASQQVWQGEEIDTSKGFENLQVGDLLFFGEKSTDEKPEKVVHVGMWIGDNQFIHSSGMVRISSFDKNSAKYDGFNLSRYLRAKRILNSEIR